MEMFVAEEPGRDSAEEAEEPEFSAFPGNGGIRRIFHNFCEAGLLPILTAQAAGRSQQTPSSIAYPHEEQPFRRGGQACAAESDGSKPRSDFIDRQFS